MIKAPRGEFERIPIRMLVIVGLISVCGSLCLDMYVPALPAITKGLHSYASAVQLSLTSCLAGFAIGQLVFGPISDRFGRRPPLVVGLLVFLLASVACALAPNIATLVVLRFVQGLGGAAGTVISRAVVRDQYSGITAARFFSTLLLFVGVGPVLAPQIGSALLWLGSWRIIFVALAIFGSFLLVCALVVLPETLPPAKRSSGGLSHSLRAMRGVATDRRFLANAVPSGFAFGAVFAYVAGAPFALENVYGLSPQQFSLIFALNSIGLIAASQVNGRVVHQFGSARLLAVGLIGMTIAGVALLVIALLDVGGLGAVLACMFVVLTSLGLVLPNASALALNDFPQSAGSASALLGILQFGVGAVVAPLVGLGGKHDVLPMAVVIATCTVGAVLLWYILTPPDGPGRSSPALPLGEPAGDEIGAHPSTASPSL
jgi:DHA1 family bicyclomycin/chloramphenicol resistance-like MFS transporter